MESDAAAANPFQLMVFVSADAATLSHHRLYHVLLSPYTAFEDLMLRCMIPIILDCAVAIFLLSVPQPSVAQGQNSAQKPKEKPANKQVENHPTVEARENPAQIELLETRIRFEADGASRKEVHARVKINNELGARQFARLNFDYNRSFEQIEIPLVQITHASGGTAEVLPGAISDQPNPAVANAPAYQDVRIKSVRILGLGPGDSLEYRVITIVSHHPLAPDFWLEHSFDRTGVVTQEDFQVDLPAKLAPPALIVVKNEQMKSALASRLSDVHRVWTTQPTLPKNLVLKSFDDLPPRTFPKVELFVQPSTPAASIKKTGAGADARVSYSWQHTAPVLESERNHAAPLLNDMADVELGLGATWWGLSHQLYAALRLPGPVPQEINDLSHRLTQGAGTNTEKIERIYDFVSKKIRTIDLPLGATGFHPRSSGEILSSGYATPEDKYVLFEALARVMDLGASAVLIGPSKRIEVLAVRPSAFTHLVVWGTTADTWLDPSLEVAPFRALPASYLGSSALFLGPVEELHDVNSLVWTSVPMSLPFPSSQKVDVDASLDRDGKLTAKVKYALRGENELLLRVAFHQSPKEKWKQVAQLLALSDGFRGQITNATASDPYSTKEPFTVEYEVSQPKFVDWSKKPVRIPVVLPLVGLPDPPAKTAPGAAASPIDLGTPLDIEARVTLHLPSGTTATSPTGTSVQRDYATFSSSYSARADTISASRHLHFLLREVPAARASDYNALVRAVQNDETQQFTLERAETPSPKTNSAEPTKATPPKPNSSKP
jgi:Domain of Unknown Function with PDB structure (DUF3857)